MDPAALLLTVELISCRPRAMLLEYLDRRFAEETIMEAYNASGHLIEFTGNTQTGTWSILYSSTPKVSCVIAEGMGWRFLKGTPKHRRSKF